MADKVIVVCDDCGKPAFDTVKIRYGVKNFDKDLCEKHIDSYLSNSRAPRKGKRKGSFA